MFLRFVLQAIVLLTLGIGSAASQSSFDDLLKAVNDGDSQTVAGLLAKGLDPNSAGPDGNTLLMTASRLGHQNLVVLLIDRKASVTRRSPFGDTALMFAASKGQLEVARILVAHGAQVSHDGWQPLHYAAFEGHPAMIRFLLERGAPKDALAPNGYSALMLAARNGHLEAARALLHADADVTIKGPKGQTALSLAQERKATPLVDLLKRAGAVE
jgi:ankyrin repeat protein